MELVSIPLDQITVGPRLREVDPDWVALIAASMAERGQDTPVQVRRTEQGFRLVAGAHRMAALREAGIPNALATVVEADEDEARLIEIDENLMRRELSELDRASFLLERQAIYERLNPATKHGGDRKGDQVAKVGDLILPPRFTAETAGRIGFSERTVQRLLTRAKRLAEVRQQLAGTRWADNGAALDALAGVRVKHGADALEDVVAALTRAEAPAASVAAALAELGLRDAPDRRGEALNRLITAWRKATAKADRRAFLQHILADEPTLDLVNELLEDAEYGTADNQTRVLRAVGKRGGR